ncbi:MAG: hypothetical protein WCG06_01185 [Candidatus Omnitrophota bacterium]
MNITPEFLNRNQQDVPNNKTIDALKIIDYILSINKNNVIRPSSILYALAVNQYNETIKNTLTRMPIPIWFCGNIDNNTGLLDFPNDEELRVSTGVSSTTNATTTNSAIATLQYPKDRCLNSGIPGSPGYALCIDGTAEDTDTGGDLSTQSHAAVTPHSAASGGVGGAGGTYTGNLLVLKYKGHEIDNGGKVTYVNYVLTSNPFDSANPVCVQYNDTQTGEVTVWKDQSSRGRHVDTLPSNRGINKIVIWYE